MGEDYADLIMCRRSKLFKSLSVEKKKMALKRMAYKDLIPLRRPCDMCCTGQAYEPEPEPEPIIYVWPNCAPGYEACPDGVCRLEGTC
tara:strand:+ start:18589 stop:18852 length:264 start_codon:yes stop_codon:yes gene_type:complete